MRPLAIDLFTGLHGWAEGLIAEGWYVIGVDITDMSAAVGVPKPEHFSLLVQDVLTLHGAQFRDARLIVSSSPCTDYAYMAMPWRRAKARAAQILGDETGEELRKLNALFDAQFRIQREASDAAGRHIPMVVENVRGARPWVGPAAWNFGSYYLWGDVPALMPQPIRATKVPGFRFDGTGKSFQSASVAQTQEGRKHSGDWFRDPTTPTRQGGVTGRKHALAPDGSPLALDVAEGRKGAGAGEAWFDGNLCAVSSASPARKAASAQIAKIPEALARHIGRVYLPR